MSLTPEQRSLRARMGGYAVAAKHDTREITKPARKAFMNRFEDQCDPDRVLPELERQRRAEAAKKLYFEQLAWKRWHRKKPGGS